ERHGSTQGTEEAADENTRHTPAPDERLTPRQNLRIARQRPYLRDLFLVFETEPVRDPVAKRSPNAARDTQRPEADAADADQRADRNQRAPGRDQQRNE